MKFKQLFRNFFNKQIYVIGDSHCEVFNYINSEVSITTKFIVKIVPGATALGLVNPNSKTNALKEFSEFLSKADKKKTLIILIGEVDTGFLIWYRNKKLGFSIESQLNASLISLQSFIEKQKQKGFNKIFLMSVPLPTIGDDQSWGEVANARKEVSTKQIERTILTLEYNSRLKIIAEQINVGYISLDDYLIEGKTGCIAETFLNPDPTDHHLNNKEYGKIILQAFSKQKVIRL
jgi:hypothetical protein